jgi:topoisomerase-4 subunit A
MSAFNPDEQFEVGKYAERAYLDYAIAVVKDRALAQIQDGKKPVQRRILYAMREMGLGATGVKPVKSARVVGDVLGKYHPHGDQSAYDAMVRMAQDFTLRYPLIDGQGNFGSPDGDGAAAMRYTEARLSPISDLLLSEIDLGTVDFKNNYDGAFTEPTLLPARLPFLLLNGVSGIAVGMACEIPPHNLVEVANASLTLLHNPAATTGELLEHVKGPDFPGGGQLISTPADISKAYEDGRTTLHARARWRKEEMARGQWRIIVYELPYQVSAAGVLAEIEELTNPKIKNGKKTLTQEQATLKQVSLSLLEEVVDQSGRDARVRLVITPKKSSLSPDDLMAFLFANTKLESSVSFNMNMIGLDGKPKTRGLREIISEWISFRFTTVTRRTQFQLDKALDRMHVLEGRMVVYLNVDEVIATIREADDPKAALILRYSLSDRQVEDILDMRLRQLARLDHLKIEKELNETRKEAERLRKLLDSKDAMKKLIGKEIEADRDKYGDARRTLVEAATRTTGGAGNAIVQSVSDEPCTVVLSRNLWIRRLQGHDVQAENLSYKDGDGEFAVIRTRTSSPVVFLDDKGRLYAVTASDLPSGRGDGTPLTTLIEVQPGSRVAYALGGDTETSHYLFAGQKGFGFVASFKNMVPRLKKGKDFLTLQPGELPMAPVLLPADSSKTMVVAGGSEGKVLFFPLAELPRRESGGAGSTIIKLEDDETLSCITLFDGDVFRGTARLKGTEVAVEIKGTELPKFVSHRARKGCYLNAKKVVLVR